MAAHRSETFVARPLIGRPAEVLQACVAGTDLASKLWAVPHEGSEDRIALRGLEAAIARMG